MIYLAILFILRQINFVNAVGLAPGLYCGLETCYDGLKIILSNIY